MFQAAVLAPRSIVALSKLQPRGNLAARRARADGVDELGDECWIGVTYNKPLISGCDKETDVNARSYHNLINPHSFPGRPAHTWALYGGRRYAPIYGPGDVYGLSPRVICAATYRHVGEKMKFLWDSKLRCNTVHVRDVAAACWHVRT